MVNKRETFFKSCDKKTRIHVVLWLPDKKKYPKPVAVLQIAHGMQDYAERFSALAEYMAEKGILVVGNDHLGHGKSINTEDDYGYFRKYKPEDALVTDMHRLTSIMKKKFPGVPYFLAGHSMGSFMTRKYISIYGDELDGAILIGTGNQPGIVVGAGIIISDIIGLIKGERYRSQLISKLMFGAYNSRIPGNRTKFDWLTRDESIVDAYIKDKSCTFLFTINGYKGLLRTIRFTENKKNIAIIPNSLPVLMVSGDADPVGNYGRDVVKAYETYHKNIDDVELILYEDGRHEICNELNKEEVYEDMYDWIMKHICI
ncbi:MAG: alpha/beta fold hydrolase [Lachnospira sp.]